MITVIISKNLSIPDYSELLIQTAEKAIHFLQPGSNVDLSINLMNDAEIQALNSQYRGIEKPTDVLSFESGEIDPDTGIKYLGDIAVSFDRALAQSSDANHPVENEIQLLIIHGILHLLGFDHDTPENKKQMWNEQAKILDALKISLNKISGDETDA